MLSDSLSNGSAQYMAELGLLGTAKIGDYGVGDNLAALVAWPFIFLSILQK
jgi:hypothetical protein